METLVHAESGLRKATLTDRDLAGTPWPLTRIHALAVTDDEGPPDDLSPEEFLEQDDLDPTAPSGVRLHLDIDFIVRSIDNGPMRDFTFWVAPATLIFDGVWNLSGELRSICQPLELSSLRQEEGQWRIEERDLDLRFEALWYKVYVRQAPRFGRRVLRMAERGGINFEAGPFA